MNLKISRTELAELLADRMTDAVDMDSLLESFRQEQFEFYMEAHDETLIDDANALGIFDPETESLEITD